ncbi:MAG: redoxin domain-containing protein [Bacteroidales bacterium]|nr:redoxin domain-containing protein [Bacteroidales bacterium]
MKRFLHLLIFTLFFTNISFAQLDGSGIAPDFTLTDIDGTSHTLYDYLDQGKVVVLDFFATWCGPCNNNADAVEEVWAENGPDGDNTIMMFLIESDDKTTSADLQTFMTAHNVTCPTFDDAVATGVPGLYEVGYYPTYYIVYSDRSYKQVSGDAATIKSVMKTAISENPGLSATTFDARVLEFDNPKGSYCSSSITPVLTIQNYGTESMTALTIKSIIDDVETASYSWTGSLAQYEIDEVTLDEISGITEGAHNFTFKAEMPNGNTDVDATNNSENTAFIILSNGVDVTIKIRMDQYPSETSWNIKKGDDIYAAGNRYKDASTVYTEQACLELDSCYTFTLFDSYGDGMTGSVKIYIGDLELESKTGFSGSEESLEFCVSDPKATLTFDPMDGASSVFLDQDLVINIDQSVRLLNGDPITDPASLITLKTTDETGDDVLFTAIINEDKTKITIDPDSHLDPNQVYYLSIESIETEYNVLVESSSVSFTSGTLNGILQAVKSSSINLYPNPVSESLNINFNLLSNSNTKVNIYNQAGQLVKFIDQGELTKGDHNIKIDLSKLNNGLYFVSLDINNQKLTQKIQVIK